MSRVIERSILQQREEEQENLIFDPQEQLRFEAMSFSFIQKVQSFVHVYKSFWKLLLRENPSKQRLIETSKQLSDGLEDIETSFEALQKLERFVGEYLRLYSAIMIDFEINREKGLSLVRNVIDHHSRTSMLQSVKNNSKKAKLKLEKEISLNKQQYVLTLNTDAESFGTIKFASHGVHEVLGYAPKQLRGCNITKLVPELYAERHEQLMANFLENDK